MDEGILEQILFFYAPLKTQQREKTGNSLIYYKDEEKLGSYLKKHLSDKPIKVVFQFRADDFLINKP